MQEGMDDLILVEAPTTLSGQIAGLEDHILRAASILKAAHEPMTVEDFHLRFHIPLQSTYRVVRALTKLGWLRVCGYRTRAGGSKAAKLYVSTSSRLPVHPHPCGRCRMTLYSPEHERVHRCR